MNANIDHFSSQGSATASFGSTSATLAVPFSQPLPSRDKNGFRTYDEEWAAFLAERSIRKSRPGINNEVPEALPRVWNNPV